MQENVKTAWKERLYASASAVALGCLSPVNGNAGVLDIVSSTLIDPALLNMPRVSAPSKWSAYKPELQTESKHVALAVPMPAMAPVSLQAPVVAATLSQRRMSPLDIVWSSPSPKPSLSEHTPVNGEKSKPVHNKQKPIQAEHKNAKNDHKHKSTQASEKALSKPLAMRKATSVKMAAVTSLSSLPPSVAPAADIAAKSEENLRKNIAASPITPAVTPTAFRRNGKSPLEIIASLQREEIKVGVLLQDEPGQSPVAELALAKKDVPVTKPVESTEVAANEQKPEDDSLASLQDIWKDFESVQDAVPALEPAAGASSAKPESAQVTREHSDQQQSKAEAESVTSVSLGNAMHDTQTKQTESVGKNTLTHSSPLAITSGVTTFSQGLWQDFDKVSEASLDTSASTNHNEFGAIEPAAGAASTNPTSSHAVQEKSMAEKDEKVKKAPADIKPVIHVSLTEAAQITKLTKPAETAVQKTLTHSSPLEITSSASLPSQGHLENEKASESAIAAAAPTSESTLGILEPAAGGEPLSLMPPAVAKQSTDIEQAMPDAAPLPSASKKPVSEKKAISAEEIITTDDAVSTTPAPGKKSKGASKASLSAESLAVLDSLPPEVRSNNTPKKNVKLERSNKAGSEEDDVKKHEAYGMKISVKRPKVDVFRMLESAYNSLIAGDQQYAITLYKEVLDEEPDNTLALFGLATTYHRAGQTTLARPLYAKLLEIDPHNVEGLNNFLVLLADESPDAALEELEKLRQSHPSFSPVLAQMALIHERRGEYELAAQKLAQANSISPENLKYQYNMAIVLDKMKDWPEASKWYQRLLTASERGEKIPGNPQEIQQRLTFIRSNTSTVN